MVAQGFGFVGVDGGNHAVDVVDGKDIGEFAAEPWGFEKFAGVSVDVAFESEEFEEGSQSGDYACLGAGGYAEVVECAEKLMEDGGVGFGEGDGVVFEELQEMEHVVAVSFEGEWG